ncbi:hydantoinase B/oxoprolinase family protein [Lichenihabitans sp. Uapishka_5]|uniref:hydantoinase B/oxoprolinase family protein n=1 Tax=Lichenihabitans sp. Uapishka_5 TaxID=3037302 RepID=UPI0029E7E6CB|nr:hydantoinase B/oxoprolinase family protein [Lichenihabitans sp. Uapishka_5]MDX7952559.1 hydantoinase B/oxoprolinase family protein [Lichenihabitans sp. Uapishka_5]
MQVTDRKTDLFTMLILRRRFEGIIREMAAVLARSGRSGILNTALDFSCSIVDRKMQSIASPVGLPVHVGSIHLIPQAVVRKFGDDVGPGDCFANNSGYHGNTHCADLTLCVPVFFDGKLAFYSIARAHLSDMGFPTPDTYSPLSKDYYQEGLQLPCIRIQRDFRDIPEVLDICKANIRAPEQFFGDYQAIVASVRTGEQRIQELVASYGVETVEDFLEDYQTYAETMAVNKIRALPGGRVSQETFYDSELDLYPDGIPVRAVLTVDPEAAIVEIDLTDNIDNVPLGINMNESTILACCVNAVLNVLGPEVPRSTGAFRRIKIVMREGSAIGLPKFPAATCAATTNLCHVLPEHIQSMFTRLRPDLGTAFATIGNPASCPGVSGTDSRHGDRPFVNQIMLGYWGGPALPGHDGWLTFGSGTTQGMLWQSSVELVEQQQPILVERLEISPDSGGAGEWEGGPGAHCIFQVRNDAVGFAVNAGGTQFPPGGAGGGLAAAPTRTWRIGTDGRRTEMPISFGETLQPGERLETHGCGGGGFGPPLRRDPALVAHRAREGWISEARAHDVYGVVLAGGSDALTVDVAATEARRASMSAATTSNSDGAQL